MPEIGSLTLSISPVAYYKLESDGTDQTANSNNLTVTGSPTFGAGRFGNGVTIDSSTKHLDKVTGCTNLPVTAEDFSFSLWIKRTGTLANSTGGYSAIGIITDGNNFASVTPGSVDNSVRLVTYQGGTASFGTDIPLVLNTYHNIICIRNNSTTTFISYKDGALVSTDTVTGRNIGSCVTVRLGESFSTWNCQFDDVAIFRDDLTAADVKLIYGAGRGGFFSLL